MPKSLKDIIGTRAGRDLAKGEEDFLDQHKVSEKDYPVKQKVSNVPFKADNIKKDDSLRHGHNAPGASESKYKDANEETLPEKTCNNTMEGKMCPMHGLKECMAENKKNMLKEKGMKKEDVDQIDELSPETLKSYKEKLLDKKDKSPRQSYNRLVGSARATRRIDAQQKANEDVDYEGEMAKTQLKALANKAATLSMMMKDDQQLEAWVQSKISNAKQMVDAIHDYLVYRDPPEMNKETTGPDSPMTFPHMNVDNNYGAV